MTIPVARIHATQLQQCLVTGKKPSESIIQATLDLISLGHGTSDPVNLADKMLKVSHTLECTSNQPSTVVPVQINSSRGTTPTTAEKEIRKITTNITTLYVPITNGNTSSHTRRHPTLKCSSSQHQLIPFRTTALNIPEQRFPHRASDEDAPSIFSHFLLGISGRAEW